MSTNQSCKSGHAQVPAVSSFLTTNCWKQPLRNSEWQFDYGINLTSVIRKALLCGKRTMLHINAIVKVRLFWALHRAFKLLTKYPRWRFWHLMFEIFCNSLLTCNFSCVPATWGKEKSWWLPGRLISLFILNSLVYCWYACLSPTLLGSSPCILTMWKTCGG